MTEFLISLLQIIFVNIILSGDNAVVIALACRNLPTELQKKATIWGSAGAIILRVLLTFVAVWLLSIPYLQVVGSILLLWIAIKLLKGEDESEDLNSGNSLKSAIKTIIVADIVMSLDNVVAVAGSANGNLLLILIGLGVSIPLIIFASQLLMKLMSRFPILVTIGSAILGYTAGEMILKDKAVGQLIEKYFSVGHYVIPIVLTVLVVVVGKWLGKKKEVDDYAI
jgi:YjbE family integral membrane protein